MQTLIRKAVFPVAGLGTRFLPATKAMPKEMLPVVDRPLIQYAVEEAYSAGIRQMVFVTGRTKRSIEDHFDNAYELERELEISGKTELLTLVNAVKPSDMDCVYVRQAHALGLGHAVLCARPLIGDEAFAVILADDLMIGDPPVMAQMTREYARLGRSILAVQDVPREETKRYGIVSRSAVNESPIAASINEKLSAINGIVEKPEPKDAPSTLAVAGRYILSAAIFEHLLQGKRGVGGEIQLTDAIASLLREEAVFAYRYDGVRYDCGSKLGFLQATVELGQQHPEIGEAFSNWLRESRESSSTLRTW
jgi:UTP--glucose-1-phosphate uridylyltransferase